MLYTVAAYIFSRKHDYLSTLAKSELAVYFFCRKVAIEAEENGYHEIANVLNKQAESEYNHAVAFSSLISENLPESYNKLVGRGKRTIYWTKFGTGENAFIATSLSQGLMAKIFFRGKAADHYSFFNKLIFMHVLEMHQEKFYSTLMDFTDRSTSILLKTLVKDELRHSQDLLTCTYKAIPSDIRKRYLQKWKTRSITTILKFPFAYVYHACRRRIQASIR